MEPAPTMTLTEIREILKGRYQKRPGNGFRSCDDAHRQLVRMRTLANDRKQHLQVIECDELIKAAELKSQYWLGYSHGRLAA